VEKKQGREYPGKSLAHEPAGRYVKTCRTPRRENTPPHGSATRKIRKLYFELPIAQEQAAFLNLRFIPGN